MRGENKPVANFSIACDRDYGDGTDFYDVVAWDRLAQNVSKYLSKGREVLVVGRMQKRSYETKVPGTDVPYSRDVWELHAEKVQFLGSAKDAGQSSQQGGYGGYQKQQQQAPSYQTSGDLPF